MRPPVLAPSRLGRRLALASTILLGATPAMAIDLAPLWNHSDPAASEQRFRDALATASGDDAIELQTQIARTYGLRRRFDEARRILAGIEPAIGGAGPAAQVRYHLELGRTYASTTHKADEITPERREKARAAYMTAFDKAKAARLDYLALDALHMMVMVDSAPEAQLAWNEKAIAYMEASSQDEAKGWEGSLRNNVGYAYHLAGRYDEAIAQYRLSLAAHERQGRPANVRIAWWMIARTLRAQGKAEEAIAIQLRLEREWDAAGAPDPYVYEELEVLYRQAGDAARADAYAAKLKASRPAQ
jgi:tetratricopeptide (TPR) repeat protein